MSKLFELRHHKDLGSIDPTTLDPNPIVQCHLWLDDAIAAGFYQPNAMSLSTVDVTGQPSSRIVLLKELSEQGFYFYTNYHSRKGQDIAENSKVSLLLYWDQLERQIRIEGIARKTSKQISDHYFAHRPRDSQLGAWASPQSEIIENYQQLKANELKRKQEFENREVPRPENWGGYVVEPNRIEMWQGRPNRLHDRLCYMKEQSMWIIKRLAP
ncbi:MAG: pyridoxamine 5'-phosphate oxidase [Gammaproteobacteria bacterium]|nr:pyridoxamine 5'-phosphate oxidase [Gammaproteobacteria bacterium]